MNFEIKIMHTMSLPHFNHFIIVIEPGDLIYVNMLVSRLESD